MDLLAHNYRYPFGFGSAPFTPFGASSFASSLFNDPFFDNNPFSTRHHPYRLNRMNHRLSDPFFDPFDSHFPFESGFDYIDRLYKQNGLNSLRYDNFRRQVENARLNSKYGYRKYLNALEQKFKQQKQLEQQKQQQQLLQQQHQQQQQQQQQLNQGSNTCSENNNNNNKQLNTQDNTNALSSANDRGRQLYDYFSSSFDDFFNFPSASLIDRFFDYIPDSHRQFYLGNSNNKNGNGNELVDPNTASALVDSPNTFELEIIPENYLSSSSWNDLPDNPKLSQELASRYSDSSSGSYFQASFNNKDGWKYIKASWPYSGPTSSSSNSATSSSTDSKVENSSDPSSIPSSSPDLPNDSASTTEQPTVGPNGELRMKDPIDNTNEYIIL